MIECYFKWCQHHCKDEPFCCRDDCTATLQELAYFSELREQELNDYDKRNKND